MTYQAINWNDIEDQFDKATWEKLTSQFWLDTRIPLSNDISTWNTLRDDEKQLFNHVFMGLTMLDTLQSQDGILNLLPDTQNQKEIAVLNNIKFMESVHAKSYSSIFETLNNTKEIDELFEWSQQNKKLQDKVSFVKTLFVDPNPMKRKVASVLLESFMFYSGFFTPLYYLGNNKMVNVAEIIKLIIRDESVHGTYIGYKFQKEFNRLSEQEQEEMKMFVFDTTFALYDIELAYTEDVYKDTNLFDDVQKFLEYNANKALMNLGFDPLFPTNAEDVNTIVMNGINTTSSNHDFFSTQGDSYLLGKVEATRDSDYDIM